MTDMFKGTVTPKDWMAVGIILAIVAALAVVYVFFVDHTLRSSLDQLITDDSQVQSDLRVAYQRQKNIDKLREETQQIDKLVSDFELRLPSERDIPRMVREFEDLANEVGLSHALKPESPQGDERKDTIPYTVSTFGTFHQTASFINRLERYERYVKISDLKIGEEDNGVSKGTFTLSTYRFIEKQAPEPPGAAPGAAPIQPGATSAPAAVAGGAS
jgi:type IV pilus assembly protein PilO